MKRAIRYALVLLGVLLLASSLAKSLPTLAPKGAVFALYLQNLAVKKAYFVHFQAELKRQKLTVQDLLALFDQENQDPKARAEAERILRLFSVDAVGQEGLLAVYPDGSFLALARPSAKAQKTYLDELKKALGETQNRAGWNVKAFGEGDYNTLAGYRGDTLLFLGYPAGSPAMAKTIFDPDAAKGLSFPLKGDVVWYLDFRPLSALAEPYLRQMEAPDRVLRLVRAPKLLAGSLEVVKEGLESQGIFALDRQADPELAELLLQNCRPWPLADFPKADSAASYCFPLPGAARYLNALFKDLEVDFSLDLTAFGDRLAVVSFAFPSENPAQVLQKPLGDMLLYLEARDDLTAETTLLTWLQMLAAASTPEGQGGFEVKPYRVGPYEGKKITLGIGQPVFLFNLGDRIALATSEAAAQALAGPKLGEDPDYRRLAERYPKDAVVLGFSKPGPALKLAGEQLVSSMPLFVEDPEELQAMMEFGRRVANFLAFLGDRLGASYSYARIEGDRRVSYGFTEVRW